MHVTSLVLALAAVAAHAAPSPEPQPWCYRPGEPCWKVKRVADAFAEAIKSSGGLRERTPEAEYSNAPGGAAYNAKRSLNELAHLAALTARNPDEYYNDLGLENEFEADEGAVDKRAPEPWCYRPGEPCWKRDATPDDVPTKDKRWCYRPGEPCWKTKRAADAVLKAIRSDDGAAEAPKPAAGPTDPKDLPFQPGSFPPECNGPRILCWKKREAAAEAAPDANPAPWCYRPGEPCWKAKRDLHALEVAARNIVDES
ncbi:hypothetical protein E4U41_005631 [Claviceps citrina]|nr:hypothetical protein E4U41_005631 [Claviceps citrina]